MGVLNFFRKLLFQESPETVSSPLDEAIIISCYFDTNEISLETKEAFDKFFDGIKGYNYKIVECVIGETERNYRLSLKRFIQNLYFGTKKLCLITLSNLYQQNINIFSGSDADIIFTNPNWFGRVGKCYESSADIDSTF
jgi:hypothetical protein